MRWTWDISFGQAVISVPVIWLIIQTMRVYHMLLNFRIEHEFMVQDWCARQNPPVKLMDLPTRQRRWW